MAKKTSTPRRATPPGTSQAVDKLVTPLMPRMTPAEQSKVAAAYNDRIRRVTDFPPDVQAIIKKAQQKERG